MEFLTNDKLVIVGAGGAIGSNMAQTALMLGLTPNICLYDIYGPGVNGVAEELYHCAFEGATSHGQLILRLLSQALSTSFLQVELLVRRV